MLAAALVGAAVGLLFGGEAMAFVGDLWSNAVLPAFHKLLISGAPWC